MVPQAVQANTIGIKILLGDDQVLELASYWNHMCAWYALHPHAPYVSVVIDSGSKERGGR